MQHPLSRLQVGDCVGRTHSCFCWNGLFTVTGDGLLEDWDEPLLRVPTLLLISTALLCPFFKYGLLLELKEQYLLWSSRLEVVLSTGWVEEVDDAEEEEEADPILELGVSTKSSCLSLVYRFTTSDGVGSSKYESSAVGGNSGSLSVSLKC